jgi:2-polyprenyl-6-methoxyphenol hydroxylase-like FAD-dependent oxidoreductase
MIEEIFLEDLRAHGVEVVRNSPFVSCTTESSNDYIATTCEDLSISKHKVIRSKYVVGCDGAHSKVRKSISEVEMLGESGKAAWGVLDGLFHLPCSPYEGS